MSFSLLMIGLVLGVIGLILFLILAVIAISNNNKRNIIMFSTFFLVCVIVVFMSVSEMIGRASSKVRNTWQTVMKEQARNWEEERLAEEKEREAYLDWLKSIAPDEYKDSLSFYDTFDPEKNVYCIPMVHPYRLEMDDIYEQHARLATTDGSRPEERETLVALTKVSFDESMMLAKRDISCYPGRMPSNLPEVSYIIFEFRTGKTHVLLNQQALIDKASEMGFTGDMELEDIETLYNKL